MDHRFTILNKINRQYRWFNTVGTQLNVRLLPPSAEGASYPISHFLDSVTDLCEYALRNCDDCDMVGISTRNEVYVRDKAIGITFRWKDQPLADVILNVWEKVTQSNLRFNALETLVLEIHSVKIIVGFGRAIKTKGRPLATLANLKRSIVQLKSETNCLSHALIIAR